MGTGRKRARRRRRCVDYISGLPDELLHEILRRLPCTAEAARTSVLSHRWRRVWAHVPAISLITDGDLDAVNAALDAHAAPALDRLEICIRDGWPVMRNLDVGGRVSPLLRLASRRVTGELSLRLPRPAGTPRMIFVDSVPQTVLKVPVCDKATAIDLSIHHVGVTLRFRKTGDAFAALRVLTITGSLGVDARDLERVVSAQCPRLQALTVCSSLRSGRDLTIRSDSLERLKLGHRVEGTITVQTPRLVRCEMPSLWGFDRLQRAHVAAPNLEELEWHDTYDPGCNSITEARRHLRRLKVRLNCLPSVLPIAALFERFHTVDELDLRVNIPPPRLGLGCVSWTGLPTALPSFKRHVQGELECKAFLKETAKLPQCKVLKLNFDPYGLQEYSIVVLHLLRSCSSARKCVLSFDLHGAKPSEYSLPIKKEQGLSCAYLTTDGSIVLDLLEELELNFYMLEDRNVDLANLLLLSCGAALKTVAIRALRGPSSKFSSGKCQTVASFCRPETTIEFHGC